MVTKKQAGMGAGALATAAAVAAAGYYFYASKDAKKNRKLAAKWADGMKKKTLVQVKKMEGMSRADVLAAIDTAAAAYENVRSVDVKELARAAKELKNNWREIVLEVGAKKPAAKKAAKKTAKPRGK